jgi:hypothetical protein
VPKIDAKFDLGLFRWPLGCRGGSGFSLVELELSQFDSFCSAGISYPSGFVFPFALLLGSVGV